MKRNKVEIGGVVRRYSDGATERPVMVRIDGVETSSRVIFSSCAAYTVLSPTLPQGFTLEELQADPTVQAIVSGLDRISQRKLRERLGVV